MPAPRFTPVSAGAWVAPRSPARIEADRRDLRALATATPGGLSPGLAAGIEARIRQLDAEERGTPVPPPGTPDTP